MLTLLAATVAAVAFAVPVRAEEFGSCGPAGAWVTGLLGDPTGPTDPPFVYAEYNACRVAARPALAIMLAALLLAGVAGYLFIRNRSEGAQRQPSA